jgi:hypothetical protein
MYRHGSTCLEGPVTKSRAWWALEEEPDLSAPHEADPEIRHDLVARVRREIAAGEYDTPEKMELALHRLLASLGSD